MKVRREVWFIFKEDKYLTVNDTWSHDKADARIMSEEASDTCGDFDGGCGSMVIEEEIW